MNLMTAIPDITLEQKFSEFKLHAMKIKNMLYITVRLNMYDFFTTYFRQNIYDAKCKYYMNVMRISIILPC